MKTIKSNSIIKPKWHGLTDYRVGLELQERAAQDVAAHPSHIHLIGLEHPEVITLGQRADPAAEAPFARSSPVVAIDRGGQATLHSPGQCVIYPIMDLRYHGLGVRDYVCGMLKVTQRSLADLGLETRLMESTGLETHDGKIAFLGIRVRRGITTHGLSVNLHNDLTLFQQIRSCGVTDARLDRAVNHGLDLTPELFFARWVAAFQS